MELSEKLFQFENNLSKHGSFHVHALLTRRRRPHTQTITHDGVY